MKDGLLQIPGKKIKNVIYAESTRNPRQQVFLIFDDGTYFEFWEESFNCTAVIDSGNESTVLDYISKMGATIIKSTYA